MMNDKDALRSAMRIARATITGEERFVLSRSAAMRAVSTREYTEARLIMAYMAQKSEADPAYIVTDALENRKDVCFPVIMENGTMVAALPDGNAWRKGAYGIQEPDLQRSRIVDIRRIDLIIVPGVAFDEYCNRVGQGKGYYDRFLQSLSSYKIGFAYESQIVAKIDAYPNDVTMNAVTTDQRLILA